MSARTLASEMVLIGSLCLAVRPATGTVKLFIHEGLPIIDGVYVNDHGPYRFLVDTGSSVNLIEPALASDKKIRVLH